jgi:sodium/bile acid cotransporter 7
MAVLLTAAAALPGCAGESSTDAERLARVEAMYRDYKKDFADVEDIGAPEAMALSQAGKAVFVDVREPEEQQVSMLPGAITAEELRQHPGRYADRTLIAYCTISYRSGKLAQELKARGITLLNLRGGLLAWVHHGGKVFDAAGETRRIHVYGRKWNLGPSGYDAVW